LDRLQVLNEHQIILHFSEEIDTTKVFSENFSIVGDSGILKIIVVYPGNFPQELFFTTEKMGELNYEITGKVLDKSGREGFFKKRFNGSTKPDTITPWIKEYKSGNKNNFFLLTFSEAMDTNSLKFFIVPKKDFIAGWERTRTLSLIPRTEFDSLHFDTTYYLYITEIKDLSGNRFGPFVTAVTPDTVYQPLYLKGKVFLRDTSVQQGVAILRRGIPSGVSLIKDGEFTFEVRDSLNFLVQVITDGYYGEDSVRAGKENIVHIRPGEVTVDSILN